MIFALFLKFPKTTGHLEIAFFSDFFNFSRRKNFLRPHMLTKHILLSLVSPGLSTDTFMAIYDPEMTSECSFEEKTHFKS